jgi:hypothetical protein
MTSNMTDLLHISEHLPSLTFISNEIGSLLPQLSNFIDQFNQVVIQYDVNVISDSSGNFTADVPSSMSEELGNKVVKRIGIIDGLIDSHKTTISDLFAKGAALEKEIKKDNPQFISPLADKLLEYKRLTKSYQH